MSGAVAQLSSGALDAAAAAVELDSLSHGMSVMISITNDMLDVEALRAGRLRVSAAATDMRALLEECAVAMRQADGALRVDVDVAPEVPAIVTIDALRVRQVRCTVTAVRHVTLLLAP